MNHRSLAGNTGRRLAFVLPLAALAACTSNKSESPPRSPGTVGPSQTAPVTIAGPAGSSVTVPPGATATAVSIAISQDPTGAPTLATGLAPLGPILAVTPHGATFSLPVTVRIPFDSSRVAPGTPLMVLQAEPGGAWVPITAVTVDGDFVEVGVTSFSFFAVTQIPTRPSQGLSISIAPVAGSYAPSSFGNYKYTGTSVTRPALIPVQVTVVGVPICSAGETLEILASATADSVFSTRSGSWVSPPLQGWAATATTIDLPMLAEYDWRDQIMGGTPATFQWYLRSYLTCTDATGSSHLIAESNAIVRTIYVIDNYTLGLGDGPEDVSAGIGEQGALTLAVLGGPFFPGDADEYTVEWLRSDDGGQTWLEASGQLAFQAELPFDPHLVKVTPGGFGSVPIHWSTLTTPPLRLEDDGALYQAHACYTRRGTTTTDCVFSREARVTVLSTSPPAFTTDPQSVLVTAGGTATFTAAATGSPAPALQWQSFAPGTSTWTAIHGATGATYTTPILSLEDNGTLYRAVATNSVGSATSRSALLDVTPAPVAPSIEVPPLDVTVAPAATASFVVVARGSDPLSYQWRRNGVAIGGATGPRLDLVSVTAGDSGAQLDVVVSNPAGSVTSSAATLTVATSGVPPVAPTITTQPVDQVVTAPTRALFTVAATGTPPLSYQWLVDGVAIPGETGASYATGLTSPGGPVLTYSVVVWNAGGAVVSAGATLTVNPPTMAVQSVDPAAGTTVVPASTTRFLANFTSAIDPASLDSTSFQVTEGSTLVPGSASAAAATLTFQPSQPLPSRTTLRAQLSSAIRDTFGSTLGAPYDWTFHVAPWTRQLGSAAHDEPLSVRTDGAGNVLLAGYTAGALEGTLAGITDAFVAKLAPSGAPSWGQQLGDAGTFTYGMGVGADAAGNVYAAGHTNGTIAGPTNTNNVNQLFLRKLDPAGHTDWTVQHGATLSLQVAALAVDAAGDSFVAGWTQGSLDGQANAGAEDVFVTKYDTSGALVWTKMFGTPTSDFPTSIALDATGNILVAGYTRGNLAAGNAGIDDLFVLKLGPDGTLLWARQLGSSQMDQAWGVAADLAGSVYLAGWTRGALDGQTSHGGQDAVVVKYDASGGKVWTLQLGTAADDWAAGIAADASGGLYVVGGTGGALDGGANASATQLYVARVDPGGTVSWIFQEGAQPFGYDIAEAVTADPFGNVFAAGITNGGLDGNTNAGDYDAFVVKVQEDGTPR